MNPIETPLKIIELLAEGTQDWQESPLPSGRLRLSPIFYCPVGLTGAFKKATGPVAKWLSQQQSLYPSDTEHLRTIFLGIHLHQLRQAAADRLLASKGGQLAVALTPPEFAMGYAIGERPPSDYAAIACANPDDMYPNEAYILRQALAGMGLRMDADPTPFIDAAERRIRSWHLPKLELR